MSARSRLRAWVDRQRCRIGGCRRCALFSTAAGIGGKCLDCGAIYGWMTSQEIRDSITRGCDPDAAPRVAECQNNSPAGYSGHWREWHRGHGCSKDPEQRTVIAPPQPEWARTRADAARWHAVAPLIETLRVAMDGPQIVSLRRMFATWGDDSRAALTTIEALLAAAKDPSCEAPEDD